MILPIESNINNIKKNINKNITLIAVSKTKSIEEIKEAYNAGIRDFGENKVQELVNKQDYLENDIRWHMIGHLQRNKVKYIAGRVHLIQSLDSVRLLEEIEKVYSSEKLIANTLIEVNIGREESKSGILTEELEELLEACEKCKSVKVKGLMTVIPKGNEEICRQYFKDTKQIWDSIKLRQFKNINMEYLSMGMSGDYLIAIQEGANMIRVGQGIFGARNYNNN